MSEMASLHVLPGRLRLRGLPELRGNRAGCEQAVETLRQVPGVDEVSASPVTGSVLITGDERLRPEHVLRKLSYPSLAGARVENDPTAWSKMVEAAAEHLVGRAIDSAITTAVGPQGRLVAEAVLLCLDQDRAATIPGRTRLRCPRLKNQPTLARQVERSLENLEGVTEARVRLTTGSVVIKSRPDLDPRGLVAHLQKIGALASNDNPLQADGISTREVVDFSTRHLGSKMKSELKTRLLKPALSQAVGAPVAGALTWLIP